jgi:NTE family protein
VNELSFYVARERNTLNNKQFATEGSYQIQTIRAGYGVESYYPGSTSPDDNNEITHYFWWTLKLENSGYIPLSGAFSLGYYIKAEATFKPLLNNYYSTLIEAPVFQPNIITNSLFMEHYRAYKFLGAGLMPLYKFSNQLHARLEAYAFFPFQELLRDEYNKAYFGNYFKSMQSMIFGSLSFVSVAGPVSLYLGYITNEENPWIAQLSFGYLLFNKKSYD